MIKKGLLPLFIASVVSAFLSLLLNHVSFFSEHWWWSLAFMLALYFGVNLAFTYKTDPHKSSELLLGVIICKMLLLFTGVLMYWYFFRAKLFSFGLHFLLHYILFTVFEIRYLLAVIKNKYTQNLP